MRKFIISTAIGIAVMMAVSPAKAQVDLSAYADAEGFINVQALTCAQLANTWQEDARQTRNLVQRLVKWARQKALHGHQKRQGSGTRSHFVL